ncbi:MAG: OsmC family protein [Thermomicrobiales bacterium]
MSGLRDYLGDKKTAVTAARERVAQSTPAPKRIEAKVRVEGRSGVRRVPVRGHQFLTDSGPELGGFDLGPSPVETLLSALGGCLVHTSISQAAVRIIPLDSLEITVSATSDPRAGHPAHPREIAYEVRITSPERQERTARLVEAEKACPITSLLVNPQSVTGSVVVTPSVIVPAAALAGAGAHDRAG